MPFQTKALLIGIVVATNVGGYLLYSNGQAPDGEAVAEQADVPEVSEPVAAAPAPVERPASNGMAAAAEAAREAGLRASAEGRHDEAIARFREAIELGSTDESLVERLVAAQRARAAGAAPQPARREALPPVTPRGPGRDRIVAVVHELLTSSQSQWWKSSRQRQNQNQSRYPSRSRSLPLRLPWTSREMKWNETRICGEVDDAIV